MEHDLQHFDPVTLGWKGTEYRVAPNRCMGLLATIEEILAPGGRGDMMGMLGQPHQAHLTKLARAYAAALRYAGCQTIQDGIPKPITDEEVYLNMSQEMMRGPSEAAVALTTLATGLLTLFFPKAAIEDDLGNSGGAEAKAEAPNQTATSEGA